MLVGRGEETDVVELAHTAGGVEVPYLQAIAVSVVWGRIERGEIEGTERDERGWF